MKNGFVEVIRLRFIQLSVLMFLLDECKDITTRSQTLLAATSLSNETLYDC